MVRFGAGADFDFQTGIIPGTVQCSADLEWRDPYNTVQWNAH